MNNKIGRILKRTAYAFYTLGVFFLIFGLLLSSVTQPAKASSTYQENRQNTTGISLTFDEAYHCDGNCKVATAKVCNTGSVPMGDITTTYQVYYDPNGGNPKPNPNNPSASTGYQVYEGTISGLGAAGTDAACTTLTYNVPDGATGTYAFHFYQPEGHGENNCNDLTCHWSNVCTIGQCTNPTEPPTEPPASPAYLKIEKVVVDGDNTIDFSFTLENEGIQNKYFELANGENTSYTYYPDVEVGMEYSVSEASVTGYTPSYSADCEGTLMPGDNKTCKVTNTYVAPTEPPSTEGYLKVTKVVVGGSKGVSDFPLFVGSTSVTSGDTNDFAAGDYVVSETGDPKYVASFSGDCDDEGNVTVVVGQTKECTITNTYQEPPKDPAKLIVIKTVVNGESGTKTASDFTITLAAGQDAPINFQGVAAPGKEFSYRLGDTVMNYTVTEDEETNANYEASYSDGCTGTLADGQVKTCTITNVYVPPNPPAGNAFLTVVKVVNGGNKVVADFPLYITNNSTNTQVPVISSIVNQVIPGTYKVSETGSDEYAGVISGDCNQNGVVTLTEGQSKICTITNTYIEPHVETPTPTPTDTEEPSETEVPAPQSTPSLSDPLIPVTGADLSVATSLPTTALPRLALNLGIAMFGLAMVFHGASNRMGKKK